MASSLRRFCSGDSRQKARRSSHGAAHSRGGSSRGGQCAAVSKRSGGATVTCIATDEAFDPVEDRSAVVRFLESRPSLKHGDVVLFQDDQNVSSCLIVCRLDLAIKDELITEGASAHLRKLWQKSKGVAAASACDCLTLLPNADEQEEGIVRLNMPRGVVEGMVDAEVQCRHFHRVIDYITFNVPGDDALVARRVGPGLPNDWEFEADFPEHDTIENLTVKVPCFPDEAVDLDLDSHEIWRRLRERFLSSTPFIRYELCVSLDYGESGSKPVKNRSSAVKPHRSHISTSLMILSAAAPPDGVDDDCDDGDACDGFLTCSSSSDGDLDDKESDSETLSETQVERQAPGSVVRHGKGGSGANFVIVVAEGAAAAVNPTSETTAAAVNPTSETTAAAAAAVNPTSETTAAAAAVNPTSETTAAAASVNPTSETTAAAAASVNPTAETTAAAASVNPTSETTAAAAAVNPTSETTAAAAAAAANLRSETGGVSQQRLRASFKAFKDGLMTGHPETWESELVSTCPAWMFFVFDGPQSGEMAFLRWLDKWFRDQSFLVYYHASGSAKIRLAHYRKDRHTLLANFVRSRAPHSVYGRIDFYVFRHRVCSLF